MKKYMKVLGSILCGAALLTISCSEDMNLGNNPESIKGKLSISFDISGSPLTRGTASSEGEPEYNENSISEIDLFFYTDAAGEDDKSVYHYHDGNGEVETVNIGFDELPESIKGTNKFKIYAVLNMKNVFGNTSSANANQKTLAELKAQTTSVEPVGVQDSDHRSFKAPDAPEVFVMTNLAQKDGKNAGLQVDEENGTKATVSLKRVASKIRVALAVDAEITDEDGTWRPDKNNMRLYMSNGVRKARLDGDVSKIELTDNPDDPANSDYFNIVTSGNKVNDESDYEYAREIKEHKDGNNLTGELDNTYICYNELPHYTYPSSWRDAVTETHQPMLTIVIPWEKTENGNTTYQPTYYSVPVNSKGEIISNAYYYVRAHIGMKGSTTPEAPMPVDIESEIYDWGSAAETDVELKPIRYLILNQTDYTINNDVEITVPFNSTHPCTIIDCKIWCYGYNEPDHFGEELAVVIDDNTTRNSTKAKGLLYDYSIDNTNKLIKFTHKLFDGWFYLPETGSNTQTTRNFFNNSVSSSDDRSYNEEVTDSKGRTYIRKKVIYPDNKKIYSRFDVEITIRHTDKMGDASTPYEETVILRFYPSIYITSETIDRTSGALRTHDGWILVNGYGYNEDDTGRLKQVNGTEGNSGDCRALTTFTVTSISEEDKKEWNWVLDDPRSLYINNELSNASMDASQDNLKRWSSGNYGGPYDGTQRSGGTSGNRHAHGSGLNTMWEYFEGPNPWIISWSGGTWDVQQDYWSETSGTNQYHRTLTYYYPTMEAQEKGNIIAPKFTMVSYHAYALAGSSGNGKEVARRRCAAYQQWGYPAGRWRLPTYAELQFIKKLQSVGVILDICGGSENWSAQGRVNSGGTLSTTDNSAYTRCVYDNWYWEQVDANGTSYNKIPDPDGSHANWKKFHWGDRPKENPLLDNSEDAPTVENFIKKATRNR